jgi:hypothetical protein
VAETARTALKMGASDLPIVAMAARLSNPKAQVRVEHL